MGEVTGNGTAVTGLGGAKGFGEVELPRGDDVVANVDVSAVFESGFLLGGVHYDANALFISTDGLVSFGTGLSGVAANAEAMAAPFLAIFHADVDTRLDGEGAESGGVWLDVDTVQDCVTITWDHVGFYRRNATVTNTFQMQLFDRGNGGFEVVYRYQDIGWTAGDLQGGWGGLGGIAALIGQRGAAGGAAALLAASGDEALQLALDTDLGNSGISGLWQWSLVAPSLILGTATSDVLQGTANDDTLRGLGGSDVLMGSAGADEMDGGSGSDRADYGSAPTAVTIDLGNPGANTGQAAGDSYVQIEVFSGSGFGDTLLGGTAGDTFIAGDGNDHLDGRLGNDSLNTGAGDDLALGGEGQDNLLGGAGNDSLFGNIGSDILTGEASDDSLAGGNNDDTLFGGDGADRLSGGNLGDVLWGEAGNDRLAGGRGGDQMHGGTGNDTMNGSSGFDTLTGDDGHDLLSGRAGDDQLWGGIGSDTLKGGARNDVLDGGPNGDILAGGAGADRFRHEGTGGAGTDRILDFTASEGDQLWFGIAGALRSDFAVDLLTLPGAGRAGVAEVQVTYLPDNRVIWIVVDGADEASILLQSSMNSFDLL